MEYGIVQKKLRSLPAQAAALIAVVVLTYLPTVRGQFLWDDDTNVVRAVVLRSGAGLWRIWFEPGATQQFYPLTHTTFWLEYQLWGPNPLPYHLTNIVLHASSALLLWLLLRRLEVPAALLGALLWAVHPLQAESVAWIVERKNCLAGVLALASVLVYERFLRADSAGKTRRWVGYALALTLFAMALLSKTAVVGVPLVMLTIAWWKHAGGGRLRQVALVSPFILASIASGVTTGWLEVHHLQAHGPDFAWTPLQRILIASHAILFYATKIVLPVKLAFLYPQWDIDHGHVGPWLYVVGAVALAAAWFALRKRIPAGVSVGIFSYVAMIAPALGFANIYFMRFSFAQNHFQYFAGMGACGLLGAGLWKLASLAASKSHEVRIALGGTAVALLAAGCIHQGYAFRDTESLYQGAIRDNPDAWMAHYNLGLEYLNQHRTREAVFHFLEVLRVRPEHVDSMTNLGVALAGHQQPQQAEQLFAEVLRRRPDSPDAHFNYALMLDRMGRSGAAADHFRRAIALKADWTRAERMLAWVLATDPNDQVRNGAEAEEYAGRACERTKKAVARCLDTLAAAHAEAGHFQDAAKTVREAELAAIEEREAKLAESIRARRELYDAGKPYRREPGALSDD